MADYARALPHGHARRAPTGCPTRRRPDLRGRRRRARSTSRWARTAPSTTPTSRAGRIHRVAFPAGNNAPDGPRDRDARPRADAARPSPSTARRSTDPDGDAAHLQLGPRRQRHVRRLHRRDARVHLHDPGQLHRRLRVTDTSGGDATRPRVPITAGDAADVDDRRADDRRSPGRSATRSPTPAPRSTAQGNPLPELGAHLAAQHPPLRRARTSTNCHTHFGATVPRASSSGTFVAPEPRLPLAARARADREGRATGSRASKTVDARSPRRSTSRSTAGPTGAQLTIGRRHRHRAVHRALHPERDDGRSRRPRRRRSAGSPYAFASWSDGGARHAHDHGPARPTRPTRRRSRASRESKLAGADVIGTNVSQAAAGPRRGLPDGGRRRTGSATKLRLYVDAGSTANRLTLGLYADSAAQAGRAARRRPPRRPRHARRLERGRARRPGRRSPRAPRTGSALLNPTPGDRARSSWRDHAGGTGGAEQTSRERALAAAARDVDHGRHVHRRPGLGLRWSARPAARRRPDRSSVTRRRRSASPATAGGASPAAKTVMVGNTGSGTLELHRLRRRAVAVGVARRGHGAPGI